MDPVPSSIGGGIAATAVLTVVLLVADALLAPALFVFATFTSLCAVGGPPYCAVGTPVAVAVTFGWFVALFAFAWPLLFGGFTWGLPGESGFAHGALFGLILWGGYVAVVVSAVGRFGGTFAENLPLLAVTFLAYLLYGLVLGGVYDSLADHRTFLSD